MLFLRSCPATHKCAPRHARLHIIALARAKEPHHRQCALHVVDHHVKSNSVIAVGSGPLVTYIIDDIGARLKDQALTNVSVIPTNDVAASEAAFHGVPQTTLAQQRRVDVYIEQADEVDCACGELPFVAGRAAEPVQPSLHRMRALASAAAETVVVLDDIGCVKERLGRELPVAIQAEGWEETAEELDDEFLGDAEIWYVLQVWALITAHRCRMRPSEPSPTAGPRGGSRPYVSPEGHSIVDIRFCTGLRDHFALCIHTHSI